MGGLVLLFYERRGGDFQELGHYSLFGLSWSGLGLSWLCVSLADVLQ